MMEEGRREFPVSRRRRAPRAPGRPRPGGPATGVRDEACNRGTRCRGARPGRENARGAASDSRRSPDRPARARRGSPREAPGKPARPRRARGPSRFGLPRAPGCATRRTLPSRSTPRGRRRGARHVAVSSVEPVSATTISSAKATDSSASGQPVLLVLHEENDRERRAHGDDYQQRARALSSSRVRLLALDLGASLRGGQRQTASAPRGARAPRPRGQVRRQARGAARRSILRNRGGIEVVEAPPGSEASPCLLLSVSRAARLFRPDVLYAGDSRGHGAAVWSRAASGRPLVVHRRVVFRPSRTSAVSREVPGRVALPRRLFGRGRSAREAPASPPPGSRSSPDGLPPEAFVDASGAALASLPARARRRLRRHGRAGRRGRRRSRASFAAASTRRCFFLGSGPERSAVEARAAALGVTDRCVFAGEVADVATRLAASHLLLLPSDSEGAPLALVEAMAAGCPVLAHAVGGIPELTDHGAAGALVSSLAPEAWESAAVSLLADAEERARLIAAGRAKASGRTLAADRRFRRGRARDGAPRGGT